VHDTKRCGDECARLACSQEFLASSVIERLPRPVDDRVRRGSHDKRHDYGNADPSANA